MYLNFMIFSASNMFLAISFGLSGGHLTVYYGYSKAPIVTCILDQWLNLIIPRKSFWSISFCPKTLDALNNIFKSLSPPERHWNKGRTSHNLFFFTDSILEVKHWRFIETSIDNKTNEKLSNKWKVFTFIHWSMIPDVVKRRNWCSYQMDIKLCMFSCSSLSTWKPNGIKKALPCRS